MEQLRDKELSIIIDANTLMRGVIHPRFAFEVLNHAFKNDFELVLLSYTIEEAIRNVKVKFPNRLAGLESFLLNCPYRLIETPALEELKKHKDLVRDETDLPLSVAAIKEKVDYLVSNDKDFVGQGKTTANIQKAVFCITAGNFLRKIMKWSSKELEKIQRRTWDDFSPSF